MKRLELLEEQPIKPIEFIHTGNYGLDYLISGRFVNGGWPTGRISEIHGEPFSGKSFIAIKACAEFQKKYGDKAFIFYDDVEEGLVPEQAQRLGLQFNKSFIATSLAPEVTRELTKIVYTHLAKRHKDASFSTIAREGFLSSETIEECFQRVRGLATLPDLAEYKVLVVIDSIAALSCTYEVASQGTKVDQGQRAKALKQALRLTQNTIIPTNTTILMINHDIFGPMTMKESAIGQGPKFHAQVRAKFKRPTPLKNELNKVVGVRLNVEVDKTRYTRPYQEMQLDLLWDTGLDPYSGLMELLLELGRLEKKASWITIPGSDKNYRRAEVLEMIRKGELKLEDMED